MPDTAHLEVDVATEKGDVAITEAYSTYAHERPVRRRPYAANLPLWDLREHLVPPEVPKEEVGRLNLGETVTLVRDEVYEDIVLLAGVLGWLYNMGKEDVSGVVVEALALRSPVNAAGCDGRHLSGRSHLDEFKFLEVLADLKWPSFERASTLDAASQCLQHGYDVFPKREARACKEDYPEARLEEWYEGTNAGGFNHGYCPVIVLAGRLTHCVKLRRGHRQPEQRTPWRAAPQLQCAVRHRVLQTAGQQYAPRGTS